jgi:hypothetical protein
MIAAHFGLLDESSTPLTVRDDTLVRQVLSSPAEASNR